MPMTDDKQFQVEKLTKVSPCEAGWELTFKSGFSLFCPADKTDVAPHVGEAVRLYGRGFGYPVRGIVIEGRVYSYQTVEEAAAAHDRWCADLEVRRSAEKAQHEAEIVEGKHAPAAFEILPEARDDWEAGLAKNTDPYGRRCYTFAADWAAEMERGLAQGKAVAAIAKEASRVADTDGITGFMYGVAVSLLSHCWVHGEELRRWHNLDTQIGSEGEKANESGVVLNPALLSIGE